MRDEWEAYTGVSIKDNKTQVMSSEWSCLCQLWMFACHALYLAVSFVGVEQAIESSIEELKGVTLSYIVSFTGQCTQIFSRANFSFNSSTERARKVKRNTQKTERKRGYLSCESLPLVAGQKWLCSCRCLQYIWRQSRGKLAWIFMGISAFPASELATFYFQTLSAHFVWSTTSKGCK